MSQEFDMVRGIGKLIQNLLSLEFGLRAFLYSLHTKESDTGTIVVEYDKLNVGDLVPENFLTNYDSLGKLIEKVNEELQLRGLSDRVDKSIVEIRDAFAHGRIFAVDPEGPFRIIKFSRPSDGMVKVEISIVITPDWLKQQIVRPISEVEKIVQLSKILVPNCFPTT